MGFPDRIERSINVAHPPAKVWEAITTAEGLGTWFGQKATVDLRVGGLAQLTFDGGYHADLRIERLEPPHVFGYTWGITGLPDDDSAVPMSSSPWSRWPAGPGSPWWSPASRNCPTTSTPARTAATSRGGSASWTSSSNISMPVSSCREDE